VARGRALGWTLSLPLEDRYSYTRRELRDRITVLMGGRTAEELIFEDFTTGAANDIEKATEIARSMVMEYGMSDQLGPLRLGAQNGEVFLGRDFGHQANYSDEVAARIDTEVQAIINASHLDARAILETHRETLDKLAAALMEKETLDTPDLMAILGDLSPWTGSGSGSTANGNGNGHAVGSGSAKPATARRRAARPTSK
ncbi:MAG: cell division protease FtsH, partial [Acidimicrobiaceae bacterium]|nr:cell division protease FtsH [Acidimicrobiaceae bacterium]